MRTVRAGLWGALVLAVICLAHVPAGAAPAEEDCVTIDPVNVGWEPRDGRWKIIERGRDLFDFGDDRAKALHALKILWYYRFDEVCFVGRPHPSMIYLKRRQGVPTRNMKDDACIRHETDKVRVVPEGDNWLLTDGPTAIKSFDAQAEADMALAIIQRYHLAQLCTVGAPASSFEYWLAQ